MAELNWVVEQDNYYQEVHIAKAGNFEIVIHKIDDENYDWFVNNLDSDGEILWHSLLEGTGTSLLKTKKDAISTMNDLAKDFKAYRRETK